MLQLIKKTLYFIVPFSVMFFAIHENLESIISRTTLNGLSGFYSANGIIFGLIVAFVIQREWEMWTKLSESVWAERDAVRQLWKWSALAEEPARGTIRGHLVTYLHLIVTEWQDNRVQERSPRIDAELDALRSLLAGAAASMGPAGFQIFGVFAKLAESRDLRLNFSNARMPVILKRIVIFADILLIIQSLFIAVNNVLIDYVFTAAISMMAFTLILVVLDLDDPFKRGTWHISADVYANLLEELKKSKSE